MMQKLFPLVRPPSGLPPTHFLTFTLGGTSADMYFTSWLPAEVPLRIFLFLEVSAEAPRLFFDFPPLGFIPNSCS